MKLSVDNLTRLAFELAEQWQADLADANKNCPEQRKIELALHKQFRDYRLKRWGKRQHEVLFENATLVPMDTLRRAK